MQASPMSIATLGVERLEPTVRFYRDVIGLDASDEVRWQGPAFEAHWQLPPGSSARAVLLSFGTEDVGRILLLEFDAKRRVRVRRNSERRFFGLFNLNFYTHDIRRDAQKLAADGCELWSDPVQYDLSTKVGSPIEVILEGPDAIPINLVQPAGGGEGTRIGEVRRFLEEHGTTRTGFTQVVTTAHCVRSRDEAVRFHQEALGMEIIIDEVFSKPGSNRLLNLPSDARTHVTFMKGDNLFGKVAFSQPLNYEVPDLVPDAVAPNIGYLAMGFQVPSLTTAQTTWERLGAELFSGPAEVDLPAIGRRCVALVRCPGSGGLIQLIERGSLARCATAPR